MELSRKMTISIRIMLGTSSWAKCWYHVHYSYLFALIFADKEGFVSKQQVKFQHYKILTHKDSLCKFNPKNATKVVKYAEEPTQSTYTCYEFLVKQRTVLPWGLKKVVGPAIKVVSHFKYSTTTIIKQMEEASLFSWTTFRISLPRLQSNFELDESLILKKK